jgi:hypothetical protein
MGVHPVLVVLEMAGKLVEIRRDTKEDDSPISDVGLLGC